MALGLDFETFCEVDLKKHGLDNYIKHPSFRVLCASLVHGANYINAPVARHQTFDFVTEPGSLAAFQHTLQDALADGQFIYAQNASFERAVLQRIDPEFPVHQVLDTAVAARAYGAGSKLEAAAPQLLGVDKMDEGKALIQKFSVPQADGRVYINHVEDWTADDWNDWKMFLEYCDRDADLALQLGQLESWLLMFERDREWVTYEMNQRGWFVDLDLVKRMQAQQQINQERALADFRTLHDPKGELNFRSTPQLRKWCAERGVNSKSFDEQNVERLLKKVRERIESLRVKGSTPSSDLYAVHDMLQTKQILGGSSLSKLQTILDTVGPDGRLRDQYVHVGAGQTFRTSGRGVQMQNLKRLGPEPDDVEDDLSTWTNEDLARNLRQVFMAEHPEGKLLVGDFSSVESRGLAYLAGAEWKLDAYRNNQDMYKVLASSMFHTSYESVTKEQRQAGKVGELSCGYGAGAGAVSKFAAKMHIEMSEAEARELVTGWRSSNPEIVELWSLLDEMLHEIVEHGREYLIRPLAHDLEIVMATIDTPATLLAQRRDARTVTLRLYQKAGHNKELVLYRVFQGCFMDGRDICYHKPSELKGGKLWLDRWTKDRQSGRYKLYGGKLAGILTQSFCREIFFDALVLVNDQCDVYPNLEVIGQFHDEIVVEWSPDPRGLSIEEAKWVMEDWMSRTKFTDFPLKAVVKYDHRYTK